MTIKPFSPETMGPKDIDWERLTPWIGRAREALGRFDERLKSASAHQIERLKWGEAIASLQTQRVQANYREIIRYINREGIDEERGRTLQKIVNVKEAIDASARWIQHSPINTRLYCKLHAIIKKGGPVPQEIGRIRKRQNWIGSEGCKMQDAYFLPPEARRIAKSMNDLNAYGRKAEKDPLVQAAILFAQFLIIHPFMDGNGRVARLAIPLFLTKKKLLCKPYLFLSAYFVKHHFGYIQKLFAISQTRAWDDWIIYFLKGVIAQSESL